jgi:hypothetical protein
MKLPDGSGQTNTDELVMLAAVPEQPDEEAANVLEAIERQLRQQESRVWGFRFYEPVMAHSVLANQKLVALFLPVSLHT